MIEEIKCQRLVIVDDLMKERIVLQCLGKDGEQASIRICHEGAPVVEVTSNRLGEASIQFFYPKGHASLMLGVGQNKEAGITIINSDKKNPTVALISSKGVISIKNNP